MKVQTSTKDRWLGKDDNVRFLILSDLHIGGDGHLDDFILDRKLISFLDDILKRDDKLEIIINGDFVDLWKVDGRYKIKQIVANYGASGKEQVQEMVRLQLGLAEVPQPDDAADALAVAICHLRETHLENLIASQGDKK